MEIHKETGKSASLEGVDPEDKKYLENEELKGSIGKIRSRLLGGEGKILKDRGEG